MGDTILLPTYFMKHYSLAMFGPFSSTEWGLKYMNMGVDVSVSVKIVFSD